MALVIDVICEVCGRTKREVTDHSGVCQSCRAEIAQKKRNVHLAGLRGLTTQQRLEVIEAQLYDLDADRRLRAIEMTNVQYA